MPYVNIQEMYYKHHLEPLLTNNTINNSQLHNWLIHRVRQNHSFISSGLQAVITRIQFTL